VTSHTAWIELRENAMAIGEWNNQSEISKRRTPLACQTPSFVYLDSDNLAIIPRSKVRCSQKKTPRQENICQGIGITIKRETHTRANASFPTTLFMEERPVPKVV
jgi:hypothetical protein